PASPVPPLTGWIPPSFWSPEHARLREQPAPGSFPKSQTDSIVRRQSPEFCRMSLPRPWGDCATVRPTAPNPPPPEQIVSPPHIRLWSRLALPCPPVPLPRCSCCTGSYGPPSRVLALPVPHIQSHAQLRHRSQ